MLVSFRSNISSMKPEGGFYRRTSTYDLILGPIGSCSWIPGLNQSCSSVSSNFIKTISFHQSQNSFFIWWDDQCFTSPNFWFTVVVPVQRCVGPPDRDIKIIGRAFKFRPENTDDKGSLKDSKNWHESNDRPWNPVTRSKITITKIRYSHHHYPKYILRQGLANGSSNFKW